jgi:RNA polymerase sigma-70 factor (ECF subfamily)
MPAIAIRTQPTPAQWSERMLLRRVLRRDERAWNELVRRYRALIFRCITRVTGKYAPYLPNADLDEIYADILFSLLRNDMHKLRRYNPSRGTKLSSWIGMISINATYDYLRCASRVPPHVEHTEAPLELTAEHERTPLDQLIEKERWHHLNYLLHDFTERDRRFLELYYDKGLDAQAIASAMAISVKTVYSKKHKIRAHLRRSLEDSRRAHALADFLAVA